MEPQAYKVVNTHAHDISGCKIISRLIYARTTNIVGMNGGDQSDLSPLVFNNGEQHKDFHIIILRLQQKLSSLEKLSLLQYLSSVTWRNCQRAIKSKHSLRPRWKISSYSLTTTENWLSKKEDILVESISIYKLFYPRLNLPLQFSALFIFVLHIPPPMIQQLSIQLLQLSALDRIVFANAVE